MFVTEKQIEISNPTKTLFPEDGYNKQDIIQYYQRIFDHMEVFIRNRLLMVQRFPDGINAGGFYQKEVPEYYPEWIERVTVKKKQGGEITQVVCNSLETAVYLANQACITFHTWLSRAEKTDFPDKIILDLDPPEGTFHRIRQTLPYLRDFFERSGLTVYLMTTGSKGIHAVIPVKPVHNFRKVKQRTDRLANDIEKECGDHFTTHQLKDKREGKIYLDVQRNSYAQTSVVPYSLRPAKGAPVAVPVTWDEAMKKGFSSKKYNIGNIFRRLGQIADPWENYFKTGVSESNSSLLFDPD